MSRKKVLVIMLLVVFTFTMAGCDIFNEDIVNNQKTGEAFIITQIREQDELYVDPGTEESDVIDILNIERNKVDVVLSDSSEVVAEVVWEGANGYYNPQELDVYEFEGTALYNNLSTDIYIDIVVDDGYTLTLEIKGEGEIQDEEGKIILSSPDDKKEIRCEPNSLLQFTAVPHGNWAFRGWNGDQDSDNGFSVYITMNDHKQLQAVFGNIIINVLDKDFSDVIWYVEGKLENLIGSKIEYVEIHVELYDTEDKLITSKKDVIDNIADGEIVNWGVSGFVYPQEFKEYKIFLRNIQLGE